MAQFVIPFDLNKLPIVHYLTTFIDVMDLYPVCLLCDVSNPPLIRGDLAFNYND